MGPIVSVIIPCHNAEAFLPQCLDSLLRQSLKEIELLCVNDGSSDRTAEILETYAAKDKRIQIFSQEQRGAAAARNRALFHASGKYLSFLDADDFFEPDLFEKAVTQLDTHQADICLVNADLFNQESGTYQNSLDILDLGCLPFRQPFLPKDVSDRLFQLTNSNAWSKIIRRELVTVNDLRFQELPNTNDLYFAYMALALAERIVYIPKKLIHYRVMLKSSIQGSSWKSPLVFIEALDALKKGLEKNGLFELYKDSYQEECRRCCTYYFLRTGTDQVNSSERVIVQKTLGLSADAPILPRKVETHRTYPNRFTEFFGVRKEMAAQKGWKYTFKWDIWKILERIS